MPCSCRNANPCQVLLVLGASKQTTRTYIQELVYACHKLVNVTKAVRIPSCHREFIEVLKGNQEWRHHERNSFIEGILKVVKNRYARVTRILRRNGVQV
jgi:predicted RNA-binding protein